MFVHISAQNADIFREIQVLKAAVQYGSFSHGGHTEYLNPANSNSL